LSGADSSDTMAVLTCQLVKAQMALADAQQQLRLSERWGLQLYSSASLAARGGT
jgi:hypothetical protein